MMVILNTKKEKFRLIFRHNMRYGISLELHLREDFYEHPQKRFDKDLLIIIRYH